MKVLKTGASLVGAGQKCCKMLEHFAILLTCIKQLPVLKTYFLSSFEWPLKTGLTVFVAYEPCQEKICFLTSQAQTKLYSHAQKMTHRLEILD